MSPHKSCGLLERLGLPGESKTSPLHGLSGRSHLCDWLHFPQETGLHVENEAAHRNIFSDPGMRPDFLDLLPGIFLGVFVGEETHWSRRRITGGSAQLRVHFVICECREAAAGVVEKEYLRGSEHTIRNNQLAENIFCHRGSAGPDHVDIGWRQTQDSREI